MTNENLKKLIKNTKRKLTKIKKNIKKNQIVTNNLKLKKKMQQQNLMKLLLTKKNLKNKTTKKCENCACFQCFFQNIF